MSGRIGIFGGAFDPPHFGHLITAQFAAEELALDKVIFMPSGKHPMKPDTTASAEQRFAMTKLAAAGNPLFDVSDYEIRSSGITYSVDTIEHIQERYHPDKLYFLIGEDNVTDFQKWREPERIVEMAVVAVLRRTSVSKPEVTPFSKYFEFLTTPVIEISSTNIRKRISEGKSVRYLIRNGVELFIDMTGLYR
jgi:nicotinate-nucleotide adenylyltransferase